MGEDRQVKRNPVVLFVGTYPPQQCGIATFTQNLVHAVEQQETPEDVLVAATVRGGESVRFSRRVIYTIDNTVPRAYERAAAWVNAARVDTVSLQHEFGLYSGECGMDLLDFLSACRKPVVTTLHTILPQPSAAQRQVMEGLARYSQRLVAMAGRGVRMLEGLYGVPRGKTALIAHGVPDVPFAHRSWLRRQLGLSGRKVILTFGLLSRGKGLEYVLEALPAIRREHPEVLYLIAGQTHPNIVKLEGESYRDELRARARRLGVADCLRFENRFLDDVELMRYLQACDVYVTPYVGRDQSSSGTLSYAMTAGCAIVSTPYVYAEDLLGEGRGRLARFHDPASQAEQIGAVLSAPAHREELQASAYELGRSMTWPAIGRRYRALFAEVWAEAARAAAAGRTLRPTGADLSLRPESDRSRFDVRRVLHDG